VFAALNGLASGVATDVVRLSGIPDTFRLRVGDWRIILEYRQSSRQILVKKIGHRREVHR
jgi:mRNA-degrading endonuclease RelE of RelBE toxin-antitoxin system